jgi:hypothetical protein
MQFRISSNAGTLAGFALLAIGGVLFMFDEPPELQMVAISVLLLAAVVYLLGRIWMVVQDPHRHLPGLWRG